MRLPSQKMTPMLLLGAALCVVSVGLVVVHHAHASHTELLAARESERRGEWFDAIRSAKRAAMLWVPGSPYAGQGYARLETIARDAEARGDARVAMAGWLAMHAAARASDHPLSPGGAFLQKAETGIVRVGSQQSAYGDPLRPIAVVQDESARRVGSLVSQQKTPGTPVFLALLGATLGVAWATAKLSQALWRQESPKALVILWSLSAALFVAVHALG